MSFKIKRQSQKESYKITCDWINDFANSIEKNANYIDTLRKRNSVDKFSTIEEKMDDIKKRVGYGSIKSLSSYENNLMQKKIATVETVKSVTKIVTVEIVKESVTKIVTVEIVKSVTPQQIFLYQKKS